MQQNNAGCRPKPPFCWSKPVGQTGKHPIDTLKYRLCQHPPTFDMLDPALLLPAARWWTCIAIRPPTHRISPEERAT